METAFDLRSEPWLPVRSLDGAAPRLMGVEDALAQAHEFDGLEGETPLVTAALHRLLLAVLHRALDGPADEDAWQELWSQGYFDRTTLSSYFASCGDRWDLFDPIHPFLQAPVLDRPSADGKEGKWLPIARLAPELASEGNSALLFDHTPEGLAMEPGQAARYLVAAQAFSLGGLLTPWEGYPETKYGNRDAPLARSAVVLPRGRTLFGTLMLNLVPYERADDPADGRPSGTGAADAPAWELPPLTSRSERAPRGWLDLLTWRSKAVLLRSEASPDGIVVSRFAWRGGEQLSKNLDPADLRTEAMVAFRKRSEPVKNAPPWSTVGIDVGRSVWRDSQSLLTASTSGDDWARPAVLSHVARLADDGLGPFSSSRSPLLPIDVYGLACEPGRAKILAWRHERLSPPFLALFDRESQFAIRDAVRLADEAGRLFGWDGPLALLFRGRGTAERREHYIDAQAFWSLLDAAFARFLATLTTGRDEAVHAWRDAVRRAAQDAFEGSTTPFRNQSRPALALARAENAFHARLARIFLDSKEVDS